MSTRTGDPRITAAAQRVIEEYPYNYAASFSSVPRAGSQIKPVKIEAGGDFICQAINFGAYFDSTVNLTTAAGISGLAAMAGYLAKLCRKPSPTGGLNTNGHLGHLTLEISTNDRPWQSEALRADLITGEPGTLFFLPNPVRVRGNQTINVKLNNVLPATIGGFASAPIDAQIIFVGLRQRLR